MTNYLTKQSFHFPNVYIYVARIRKQQRETYTKNGKNQKKKIWYTFWHNSAHTTVRMQSTEYKWHVLWCTHASFFAGGGGKQKCHLKTFKTQYHTTISTRFWSMRNYVTCLRAIKTPKLGLDHRLTTKQNGVFTTWDTKKNFQGNNLDSKVSLKSIIKLAKRGKMPDQFSHQN